MQSSRLRHVLSMHGHLCVNDPLSLYGGQLRLTAHTKQVLFTNGTHPLDTACLNGSCEIVCYDGYQINGWNQTYQNVLRSPHGDLIFTKYHITPAAHARSRNCLPFQHIRHGCLTTMGMVGEPLYKNALNDLYWAYTGNQLTAPSETWK